MPDRILAPRSLVWVMYALLAAAGMSFWLTEDSESVRYIIGDWAPLVTGLMLLIGSAIGIIGSACHSYRFEVAAYPFLVGVWFVYSAAIGARSLDGDAPTGFSFLLAAGAVLLAARAIELHKASVMTHELKQRQRTRREAV